MNTVNVVEINGDDGLISGLRSFEDTPEGNREAETLFLSIVKESTDVAEADYPTVVENGFCDVPGGASIQLVHSTA